MKDFVVLEFSMLPIVQSLCSEQEQMLKWCQKRGVEIQNRVVTDTILVKFKRDKNCYDFIKTFIEPKVNHALSPSGAWPLISGIKILEVQLNS